MDAAHDNTTHPRSPVLEDRRPLSGHTAPETLIIGRDPQAASPRFDDRAWRPSEDMSHPTAVRARLEATGRALLAALVGAFVVLAGLTTLAAVTGSEWRRCPDLASKQTQREQLRRLISDKHEALVAADTQRLETLLAADFTEVSPGGDVLRRDDLIAAVGTGKLDFSSIRTDQSGPADAAEVALDCDVAIVSYRSTIDAESIPFHFRHDARHTETWVRDSGSWHELRSQTTAVGGFPPPGQ